MKYLKVLIDPILIKGDTDDLDTLKLDLYDKLTTMIEEESLSFVVDEDYEDDED